MRTRGRVKEIDDHLKKHYSETGAKECADALGEPEKYIRSRAHYLHLHLTHEVRGKAVSVGRSSMVPRTQLMREIDFMYQEFRKQKIINHKLRCEMIKLTHENMELKKGES